MSKDNAQDIQKEVNVICKTCGGEVPNHVPTILDPKGEGHPKHSVDAYHNRKVENVQANDGIPQASSKPSNIKEILTEYYAEVADLELASFSKAQYLEEVQLATDEAVAQLEEYILDRLIEELSGVRLEYGHYIASTFAGGEEQTIKERIKELARKKETGK